MTHCLYQTLGVKMDEFWAFLATYVAKHNGLSLTAEEIEEISNDMPAGELVLQTGDGTVDLVFRETDNAS